MKKILLLLAVSGSLAAGAQVKAKTTADGWKTFKHKYGFSIQLPPGFQVGAGTMSGMQYYQMKGMPYDAVVVETIGEGSDQSLQKEYTQSLQNFSGRVNNYMKDNYFIVYGKDKSGWYYQKSFVKNNQTYTLSLRYPQEKKDYFDKVIERIVRSFS